MVSANRYNSESIEWLLQDLPTIKDVIGVSMQLPLQRHSQDMYQYCQSWATKQKRQEHLKWSTYAGYYWAAPNCEG